MPSERLDGGSNWSAIPPPAVGVVSINSAITYPSINYTFMKTVIRRHVNMKLCCFGDVDQVRGGYEAMVYLRSNNEHDN